MIAAASVATALPLATAVHISQVQQAAPLQLPHVDWVTIAPEGIFFVGGLLLLLAGVFAGRRAPRGLWSLTTVAIAALALWPTFHLWHQVSHGGARTAIADAIVVDGFSTFIYVVVISVVVMAALLADGYLRREGLDGPEFYVLMLFSASGGMLMASANDLIVVFLGLEILSIALYTLAGYQQRREGSQEAAIKYFVLGAFSSAFFLYGIALVYGTTGSTNLGIIADFLRTNTLTNGLLLAGLALLIVGLGFKVAAVPFHMWTPDVYQGSPTPATAFMAAAAKAAGFAALLRIFVSTFDLYRLDWQPIVWALAVLSLVVGSILAVVQTDVKRALAYSSIAHAGYVLVGFETVSNRGVAGALFYLLAYAFMIIGSFAVVTLVAGRGDENSGFDAFRGLGSRRPALALVFTLLLLAQAGVPLTSGFLAKFYVISAAVEAGSYALAVIAMIAAVIAAFFYLRLIVVMYMAAPEGAEASAPAEGGVQPAGAAGPVPIAVGAGLSLGIALSFTLVVGFLPSAVFDFARHATLLKL
ncbi:MAG: NADH-quinone oxidoreductase subunit N [Acidimicrobiia bacterium]|nr:NADH-quinone oxidoreductase subunit N [Acidimicrobiia bacterium]